MILITIGSLASPSPSSAAQPQTQALRQRHVPPITKKLTPLHRLDGGRHLDLTIGLPLRNHDQLTNLLQELYDPSSASFRHYLSADEFATSFGPSQQDYQAIVDFAKAHGLTVKRTHANRTLVDVSGSVADIEKAFHIHMQVYQHPMESRSFFAPDVEPTVDIATPILGISGLDNYVTPRAQIHPVRTAIQPLATPLGGGAGGGGGGGGGTGSGGSYIGYDFRTAYVPDLLQDGTGQSIGLFELTGYDPDDISDYESEAGLNAVPLQNVLIDNFDGDDTNLDYSIEATADIEMAISMAPGLDSVLVYEGPTPLYDAPDGTNAIQYEYTTAQINDVLNRMATDDLAHQLSCSYQMDINLSTVQIFEQFAAQGQSFFQASGDFGAFPGAIDEPSDDPYITVVGGTTLTTSRSTGAWSSEVVWLTPASEDPLFGNMPEEASGGGVSLVYPIPVWQQGISMTANQGSTTMRNLPDVALVANNVDVVWGNDFIFESFDLPEAGTSVAAPLWAGFMAMVNQQAAATGHPPIGFVNPALYAIAKSSSYSSCFHDIIKGNNFSANNPSKYSATTGYDLCTGLGTISENLLQALLNPPAEKLVVTPPFGFTSIGPGGGPFSVTTQTYTLTNIGTAPLNWSLANTSRWLTASATSGTLNPGGVTIVTVSINSAANSFLITRQSGNISINNLTDGTTQNRQFDLYVGNGGFETGDLTDWNYAGDTNLIFALASDDVDVAGTNALDGEADILFVHSGIYGAYLGEYPDEGSLSQTVVTTAGQSYVVSFWLTCVPYQGETTPNDFTAKWNGSTLFAQTNLDAFGWTNLQFAVPATTSRTTLEYDFSNVPGAFGLDDITVEPIPPPMFQSVAMTPGNITLTWRGIANASYQIQSVASLGSLNWTNVSIPITASNNNMMSASEPIGTASQQFYRVVLMPPQ